MLIIQLFFVISLAFSSCAFAMDAVTVRNHFEDLPIDTLPSILIREDHEYPWQNFIHTCKSRQVCKSWLAVVPDHDGLRQRCNIPLMHYAAMMNNPDKIIELKFAGHSPCAPDPRGLTPGPYAIGCGQHAAMVMLNIGLVLSAEDKKYVRKGDDKTLQILQTTRTDQYKVKDLADAITQNDYKKTVVILSDDINLCQLGFLGYAESLGFSAMANLLRYAIQGTLECILFDRIYEGKDINDEFIKHFIDTKANPNAYNAQGSTFLHRIAFQPTMQSTVKKLLQLKNIDINAVHLLAGYNAINACASTGNVECLKQLLEAKKLKNEVLSDIDNDSMSCAIEHDRVDCVELLLQYGGVVNRLDAENGASPLHYAAQQERVGCLRVIMKAPQCNLDIENTNGLTPLMDAVRTGRAECMSMLLARGANGKLVTKNGCNLMYLASLHGQTECLKRLIALNFRYQINSKNNDGYSPLMNAARRNHLECMKLLINAQADINACDNDGQTALHFAANKGFDDAITLLLAHGAAINCISNSDYIVDTHDGCYAPIHFGAKSGHAGTVEILIQQGADTNIKTQLGKTALDLASEYGHSHVVALLS